MVSDNDLRERLLSILKDADLNVITERIIRKQLEEEFQCSLNERKEFLRDEVGNFLRQRQRESAKKGEGEVTGEGEGEVEEGGEEGSGEGEGVKEEEEEEEEEEPTRRRGPAKKRKSRQTKDEKPEKKKRAGGGGGLNKVCCLSEKLANLLGEPEMPRTQVVKMVWEYIRKHDLQDPSNKRKILCDASMQDLFGTKSTDMFQMNKLLSKHISPKPGENGELPPVKKPKGEGGGFKVAQPLSLKLQGFLGTEEKKLQRHEVVKRMWAYIKDHQLQDPTDKRRILCDDKMQDLFGVDTFNGFGITKFLAQHIGAKSQEGEGEGSVKGEEGEGEVEGGELEGGVEGEEGGD